MSSSPAGELRVKVTADTASLKAAVEKASLQAGEAGGQVLGDQMASRWRGVMKVAAASTVAVMVSGMMKTARAASDLQEATSKVGVVFDEAASSVVAWSQDSAKAMGMAQSTALEAVGTFGNLFTSMGMIPAEAAKMSKGLVQLAADLGSFNNIPVEDALVALRAGLVGEAEPLRRLGVNLNQAAIEAEAARLGLATVGEELSVQAKAQAAYSLILQQTSNAQGDFARTADGMANSMKTAQADYENAMAALGQATMPVVTAAAQAFSTLLGVLTPVVAAFTAIPGPVKAAGAVLLAMAVGSRLLGPYLQGAAYAAAVYGAQLVNVARGAVAAAAAQTGLIAKTMAAAGALRGAGAAAAGAGKGLLGALGGPWGIAIAGATLVLSEFANMQAEASAKVDALTASLNQQTGAITGDSIALAVQNAYDALSDADADRARQLGVSAQDLATILTGTDEAAQGVVDRLQGMYAEGTRDKAIIRGLTDGLWGQREALQQAKDSWNDANEAQAIAAKVAEALGVNAKGAGEDAAASGGALSGFADKVKGAFAGAGDAVAGVQERIDGLQANIAAQAQVKAIGFESSIRGLDDLSQAQARLTLAQETLEAATPGTEAYAEALVTVAEQEAAVGAAAEQMAADQQAAAEAWRASMAGVAEQISEVRFDRSLIGMDAVDEAVARLDRLTEALDRTRPGTLAYRQALLAVEQATNDVAAAQFDLQASIDAVMADIAGMNFDASLYGLDAVEAARRRLAQANRDLAATTPGTLEYAEALRDQRAAEIALSQAQADAAEAREQAAQQRRDQLWDIVGGRGWAADVVAGDAQSIAATLRDVLVPAIRQAVPGAAGDALVAQVLASNSRLQALAAQRERLRDRLEEAQSKLNDLLQERTATARQFTQAGTSFSGGLPRTARALGQVLARRLTAMRQFAADLKALAKRGVPRWLLQEFLAAGIEDGGRAAAQLLASPEGDLAKVIATATSLSTEAESLGAGVAGEMFDTGVAMAQGIVDGLTSQEAAITKSMTGIAAAIVAAIKKALGIASPSKVFTALGKMTALGYLEGLESQQTRVAAAVTGLTGDAVPRAVNIGGTSGTALVPGGAGGLTAHITVNNPTPERASESLPLALRRAAWHLGAR